MFDFDLHKLSDILTYHPNEPLIFSSGLFLFLFLGFLMGFQLVYKNHLSKILYVILFSLFFYYKSSGWYFLILVGSTIIDYALASLIYRQNTKASKTFWLIISLLINLGMLGYFKYTNFLLDIWSSLSGSTFQPLDIFLPVGVSFFTFQSLSYTIEIYRGDMKPVKNILDYAFFVSFFPQLVAGPIVRAHDFIPQIRPEPKVSKEMFGRAVFLIAGGLFKKAIISDYISINFVDRIFDNPSLYSGVENLMGVYGYALQIYCDFSGYSDMAIGIALLFGYELCLNFNAPYKSLNITDFWRRWHMSLSTWLKDYLYISMGGNRKGKIRTYINLFITMLLGGLWHGASLRFILWGALHGAGLALHKVYMEFFGKQGRASRWMKWAGALLTFHFVCFCWIFFRAADMQHAGDVISQIGTHFSPGIFPQFLSGYPEIVGLMVLGYTLHFLPESLEQRWKNLLTNMPLFAQAAVIVSVILIVIQVKSAGIQPFIYFQF